jgi:hypothetical protein
MYPVFGVYLVAFRFHVLLVTEIVLIAMGPILFAGLSLLALSQRLQEFIYRLSIGPLIPPTPPSRAAADHPVTWATFTNWIADLDLRGYGRFWLAITLGISAQVGLVIGFLRLNPNVRNYLSP